MQRSGFALKMYEQFISFIASQISVFQGSLASQWQHKTVVRLQFKAWCTAESQSRHKPLIICFTRSNRLAADLRIQYFWAELNTFKAGNSNSYHKPWCWNVGAWLFLPKRLSLLQYMNQPLATNPWTSFHQRPLNSLIIKNESFFPRAHPLLMICLEMHQKRTITAFLN